MEDDVVDWQCVEVSFNSFFGPDRESLFPVVNGPAADRSFSSAHEVPNEALPQRREHIILGGELQIEAAFGNAGTAGDLLNRCWSHTLLQEEPLGRIHQVLAALLRGFDPRPIT